MDLTVGKQTSRERYNKTGGTQRAIPGGKNGHKAARKELSRKRQKGGKETIHFSAHKKIKIHFRKGTKEKFN